jgi:membrane protein YqaA with SNARE-associated domain
MVAEFLDWFAGFGTSTTAVAIMFANAVGESIILPVPCDLVLMALATLKPESSLWYGALTTIGSVSGAMVGYLLGKAGGRPILLKLFKEKRVSQLDTLFARYRVWAIFIAGFTPIPYKVFTIAAGAAQINFGVFIVASFLSRGARFFIVAGLIYIFGERIKGFIDKYFDLLSIVFVILLVGGFVVLKWLM